MAWGKPAGSLTDTLLPSYRPSAEPWNISGGQLRAPFPPKWDLLWQLEAFLDPVEPGVYSLSPESLRMAVQRGAREGMKGPTLVVILENGLGTSPPTELVEALIATPRLRVLHGPVLEFHDPQELLRLREAASFRRDLQEVISPRHVHLDPWQAPAVLRRLYRRGLLCEQDLPSTRQLDHPTNRSHNHPTNRPTHHLTKADRIYLLSLLLLSEGLKAAHAPPPGLLTKLTGDLDSTSRGTAARQATELLEQIFPDPIWIPEQEPPPPPEEDILSFLEGAIGRGETIDVLYQARGRGEAEFRHLTPLLVEQRGPRFYLIAYCHSRRANRTFRLDRLRLIDFPPEL